MEQVGKDGVGSVQPLAVGEGDALIIDANDWHHTPSIEDNGLVMALVVDKLVERGVLGRVVFHQRRNVVYSGEQLRLLAEIAAVFREFVKVRGVLRRFSAIEHPLVQQFFGRLQGLLLNLLRYDPVGAYVECKRMIREEHIAMRGEQPERQQLYGQFIGLLEELREALERTTMIRQLGEALEGHHVGDRSVYRRFFQPQILPEFLYTRLAGTLPVEGEEIDTYSVGSHRVTVFRQRNDNRMLYFADRKSVV
jgi:hypothetical protein